MEIIDEVKNIFPTTRPLRDHISLHLYIQTIEFNETNADKWMDLLNWLKSNNHSSFLEFVVGMIYIKNETLFKSTFDFPKSSIE